MITNIYYWINFFVNFNMQYTQTILKQIFGVLAIAINSFLFYKGFKIAEWVTLVLLAEPILSIIFYLFHIIGILEIYNGWFMLILTILIAIIAGLFIGNENSISEFMKEQRSKIKLLNKN